MRIGRECLMLLGLVAACATDGVGPGADAARTGRGPRTASLRGVVFTMPPGPDSTRVPVPGALITLVRVGNLPVDTTPPPDTTLQLGLRGGLLPVLLLDSVVPPPDTIPVDTIPTDTLPPDTIPPPPPPGCGEGDPVARARSNAAGRYEVDRLRPGVYTILVEPPPGSGLSPNQFCRIPIRGGAPTRFDLFLWGGPGPDPFPGDST